MSNKSVFLLQVALKYEPEHCDREIKQLRRALGGNSHPVMHGKRHIAFVTTGYGTVHQLVERLSAVLEVDAFESYWCIIPARPVAAKFGGIDSLRSRVDLAYAALDAGPPKNLAKGEILVKQNLGVGAARQMRVEGWRSRQTPK